MYKFFLKGEGKERRDGLGKTTIGDTGIKRKRPHRGNDWGFKNGSIGKPVHAVADGIVTKVLYSDELQNCVIVRNTHDKVYVIVCHMDKNVQVKQGDVVIGGETVLGFIGPYEHGPHLHAAASTQPMPHLAPVNTLLDLFALMDADKAKREAVKPVAEPKAEKPAPSKKPATPKKKAAK